MFNCQCKVIYSVYEVKSLTPLQYLSTRLHKERMLVVSIQEDNIPFPQDNDSSRLQSSSLLPSCQCLGGQHWEGTDAAVCLSRTPKSLPMASCSEARGKVFLMRFQPASCFLHLLFLRSNIIRSKSEISFQVFVKVDSHTIDPCS